MTNCCRYQETFSILWFPCNFLAFEIHLTKRVDILICLTSCQLCSFDIYNLENHYMDCPLYLTFDVWWPQLNMCHHIHNYNLLCPSCVCLCVMLSHFIIYQPGQWHWFKSLQPGQRTWFKYFQPGRWHWIKYLNPSSLARTQYLIPAQSQHEKKRLRSQYWGARVTIFDLY